MLIADGCSTKTTWCLVDAQGTRSFFDTEGYNPEFIGTAGIVASLGQNLPAVLAPGDVAEVHYYGASVVSGPQVATVADAMGAVFGRARVHVGYPLALSIEGTQLRGSRCGNRARQPRQAALDGLAPC